MRIAGECAKVGLPVSAASVRAISRRHGLGPAPRRGGPSWAEFLRAPAAGTLACDFLTVETVALTRLYEWAGEGVRHGEIARLGVSRPLIVAILKARGKALPRERTPATPAH